jgi:hypothetical protein
VWLSGDLRGSGDLPPWPVVWKLDAQVFGNVKATMGRISRGVHG